MTTDSKATMGYNPQRLRREIDVLCRCEERFKLPAQPVIDRLIADADRPLPDRLPRRPHWTTFEWPESGLVNLESYWHARERKSQLLEPYL